MRFALAHCAAASGRREVVLPAYCCYSLPASVVAAGLQVRLVDVDDSGRIDPTALASLPLESVAVIVVANLFGLADPMGEIRRMATESGVAVVDDAAQSLGARDGDGAVGARGEFGVLSFGRGKPLSALGGGGLVWNSIEERADPSAAAESDARLEALARGLVYDIARWPVVFRLLSAIPSLHIGETEYDPGFRQGSIDPAARCLAEVLIDSLDASNRERRERAERLAVMIREQTAFSPLTSVGEGVGIYPRLAVRAPEPAAREAALEAMRDLGATAMYPSAVDGIDGLGANLVGDAHCPGAHAFAARLLTLPTHSSLTPRRIDRLLDVLRSLG